MFDWRELRRWKISEAKLPPGSVIRFREFTFWDRYKWRILAVAAFFLLQTILIAKLLIERRIRRKASDSLVSLNSELQDRMAEITALSRRLISAHEDERRRIAMELHDDLSQQVAVLGIRLSTIKRKLPSAGPARDAFATVEGGLTNLENSIHALSHELHPALLEHAGLVPALRAHCEEFEAVNGINAHLSVEGGRNVPFDLALCLYRVTQESLRNVAKHSGAKEAWISLTETNGLINLTIEDAGRGLDPQRVSSNGIGLVSMKERVRAVGGSLEFGSRPGGGAVTRVLLSIPRGLAASG
jgi:signal transduction histidine kinase